MATSTWGTRVEVTDDRSGGRAMVTATCALIIAGASLGDYVTARDVTFGGVEVLAIAWASVVLATGRTIALIALVWTGQLVGVRLGLISTEAAVINAASTAAVAALLQAVGRSSRRATSQRGEDTDGRPASPPVAEASAQSSSDPLHQVIEVAPAAMLARGLTARESEVVLLALVGLTATQIGRQLFIGKRTVETHLSRAYSKFGVHSRAEIAEELITAAHAAVAVAAVPAMPAAGGRIALR